MRNQSGLIFKRETSSDVIYNVRVKGSSGCQMVCGVDIECRILSYRRCIHRSVNQSNDHRQDEKHHRGSYVSASQLLRVQSAEIGETQKFETLQPNRSTVKDQIDGEGSKH